MSDQDRIQQLEADVADLRRQLEVARQSGFPADVKKPTDQEYRSKQYQGLSTILKKAIRTEDLDNIPTVSTAAPSELLANIRAVTNVLGAEKLNKAELRRVAEALRVHATSAEQRGSADSYIAVSDMIVEGLNALLTTRDLRDGASQPWKTEMALFIEGRNALQAAAGTLPVPEQLRLRDAAKSHGEVVMRELASAQTVLSRNLTASTDNLNKMEQSMADLKQQVKERSLQIKPQSDLATRALEGQTTLDNNFTQMQTTSEEERNKINSQIKAADADLANLRIEYSKAFEVLEAIVKKAMDKQSERAVHCQALVTLEEVEKSLVAEKGRVKTGLEKLHTAATLATEVQALVVELVTKMEKTERMVRDDALRMFCKENDTIRADTLEVLPLLIASAIIARNSAAGRVHTIDTEISEHKAILARCRGNDVYDKLYMNMTEDSKADLAIKGLLAQKPAAVASLDAANENVAKLEALQQKLQQEQKNVEAATAEIKAVIARKVAGGNLTASDLESLRGVLKGEEADRMGYMANLDELRVLLEGQTDLLSVLQSMMLSLQRRDLPAAAAAASS